MRTGWRDCLLGDVITLQRGFDLPERERVAGEVPIVSSSGTTGFHNIYKVKAPGVVTGRYGTLGEVHYVTSDYWPLNTTLYVKDFKDNYPLFIAYFLRTLNFSSQNAAGAVPGVNRNHLHMLSVKIPNIPAQRKIAGILSAYDDLIENNTRRIAILEEMAQAIYREWFVHFRFPGHEKVKLVDSELGKIPEGWKVDCFGNVATFVNGDRGKNYPKSSEFVCDGVPFINAGHLADGWVTLENVNRITEEVFERLGQGKIREGDLLYCVRGSLGRIARVGTLNRGAIASSLVIIRESESARASYLYYALSGEAGDKVVAKLNNGVAQPNISVESLKRYSLLIPTTDTVRRFHDQIATIWSLSHAIGRLTNNLRTTRDLLLPKLISGQVDVEGLEIEIASD